jgi:hypothetical protein
MRAPGAWTSHIFKTSKATHPPFGVELQRGECVVSGQFRAAIAEVVTAVGPLTIAVAVLSTVFLGFSWRTLAQLLIGAAFTTAGLFLFLRGVRVALLPMGEMIGAYLPKRGAPMLLVVTAFIFSFSVTIADPSVHVLVTQVASFPNSGIHPQLLAILLSGGIGFLVTIAILRILLNIPIKWLFTGAYIAVIILSFFTRPELVPLFLDSGSVSTGPMAVPCIIALGLGTASVLQRKQSLADEFGLVGLATLGPILVLMVWGVFM